MAERAALVDAVAVRAVLGDAHAAGVEEPQTRMLLARLVDLDVRVTVDERGTLGQRGRVVDAVVHTGAKNVTVRQEQFTASLVEQRGVVRHDGEVEDHLVDLGVAVAADGDDAVGQGVEQRNHALGSVVARQVVARAVVEQVAQQNDAVGLLGFDGGDQARGPVCRAGVVGGEEVFHGVSFRCGFDGGVNPGSADVEPIYRVTRIAAPRSAPPASRVEAARHVRGQDGRNPRTRARRARCRRAESPP